MIGNDINRQWLDHAEQLAVAGDGGGRGFANALAWVRACALVRDRRYADAARALSSMVDPGETSGNASLRTLPPLGQAVAAYWRRDLGLARGLLEHAMRVSLDAGVGAQFFPAVLNLFEVFRLQGDAEAAARLLQQARRAAEKSGWADTVGVGWLWYGDGERLYAANDFEAAVQAYRQAIDFTRFAGSNSVPLLATMRLAAIAHLRGDRTGALLMAHEVASTPHRPNASFIAGMFNHNLAHMWLVLGRVDEAGRTLAPLALALDDEVEAAREEEYVELARWQIACRRGEATLPLLARMVAAAEAGGRSRSVVEIQTLLALARQQAGDIKRACASLEAAAQTAAGFQDHRLFLDAGADITALLRRVREARRLPADAQRFVDALCGDAGPSAEAGQDGGRGPQRAGEPLTRQELQVLRMLGTGYSNGEIGNALFISANTVKTHLKHIYAKLDVKSRSAAVSRAAALHLLEI
jgi:LuxR family maltose regulon positive regulatory protein